MVAASAICLHIWKVQKAVRFSETGSRFGLILTRRNYAGDLRERLGPCVKRVYNKEEAEIR